MNLPSVLLSPEANPDLIYVQPMPGDDIPTPQELTSENVKHWRTHSTGDKLTVVTTDGKKILLAFRDPSSMFRALAIFSPEQYGRPRKPLFDINPVTNPDLMKIENRSDLVTPNWLNLDWVEDIEQLSERALRLILNDGHRLQLAFNNEAAATRLMDRVNRVIGSIAEETDPRPEMVDTPVEPLGPVSTATTSPLSSARIMDVDHNTNPLIEWTRRWGDNKTIAHRIMLSQVTSWGPVVDSATQRFPESCVDYLSITLTCSSSVVLGFSTPANKALFEEEFVRKLNAL